MDTTADVSSDVESETGVSWLLGGIVGGLVGAVGLGALWWVTAPNLITTSIPAMYGLEETTMGGWLIHLAHGATLGIVFGLILQTGPLAQTLRSEVETPVLAGLGIGGRVIATGFVYGIAIWAILPMLVMPLWLGTIGSPDAPLAPDVAIETLIGHVLFGVILGAVYAAIVGRSVPEAEGI